MGAVWRCISNAIILAQHKHVKKSFFFNGSASKAVISPSPALDLNGRQNFGRQKKVLTGTALPLK